MNDAYRVLGSGVFTCDVTKKKEWYTLSYGFMKRHWSTTHTQKWENTKKGRIDIGAWISLAVLTRVYRVVCVRIAGRKKAGLITKFSISVRSPQEAKWPHITLSYAHVTASLASRVKCMAAFTAHHWDTWRGLRIRECILSLVASIAVEIRGFGYSKR